MNRTQGRYGRDLEGALGGYGGGGLSGYGYTRGPTGAHSGRPLRSLWGYPHGGDHPESAQQQDAETFRRAFAGKGPKGFKRSDDRIREDVCELLMEHPEIDATNIEVEVKEGLVMLAGEVAERHQKHLSEAVAAEVMGVRDVDNRIRVRRAKRR